jgi:hypothetical protein
VSETQELKRQDEVRVRIDHRHVRFGGPPAMWAALLSGARTRRLSFGVSSKAVREGDASDVLSSAPHAL